MLENKKDLKSIISVSTLRNRHWRTNETQRKHRKENNTVQKGNQWNR